MRYYLIAVLMILTFAFVLVLGDRNVGYVEVPKPDAASTADASLPTPHNSTTVLLAEQPDPPLDVSVGAEILLPDDVVRAFRRKMPDLFAVSLTDPNINSEWIPSRASLGYWVQEYRLSQIEHLEPAYVRSLFEDYPEEQVEYADYLAMLDEPLGEAMSWPGDGDLDRMWQDAESHALYGRAMQAKHYADLADDALWDRLNALRVLFGPGEGPEWVAFRDADAQYTGLRELRGDLWDNESRWWAALWRSDEDAYPHWSFLMRVADHHFE